jgi:signal transduction histidine kinase/CheY-like chemotaxis protein
MGPLHGAGGRLMGFAKLTRDMSERLQQQQALESARAALVQAQKMEALGQLSGGIAHDYNNLLHVIRNAVEILERRLRAGDPEADRLLEMIRRNADRAATLTQRLLAFSRRQPLEVKAVDPNRLVAGMTELVRSALGEGIEMETVLAAGIWPMLADANQLEAAILNLAVNARDAMPEGGKLTVETANMFLDDAYAALNSEVQPGQYVLLAVSDTGTGMSPEVAARALDPFFTTKEVGKGTGLGLSQVYGFIKQSGGHLKLYSEPGAGTTVKLYLPRAPAAHAEETPRAAPALAGGNHSILVVEDEEDVRAFTVEVLRDLGYRVLAAEDGPSALRVLEQEPAVSLLFTDVGLPNGMNGRQLAEEAQRRCPRLKVLFTTGYARNAIVHHGHLDPGVELIVKPFTPAKLASRITRTLNSTAGAS